MSLLPILLSYWWIILILVVVLAVLVRSIVKLAIGLLVLVVVGYIFLLIADVVIGPSIRRLEKCYEVVSEASQLSSEKMQQNRPSIDEFCREDMRELLSLSACYKKIEEDSSISVNTLEKMINIIKPQSDLYLASFVQEHNELCVEYPNTLLE